MKKTKAHRIATDHWVGVLTAEDIAGDTIYTLEYFPAGKYSVVTGPAIDGVVDLANESTEIDSCDCWMCEALPGR